MKNKIYAISILLSFLAILSHEMIPHHHDMGLGEFLSFHNPDKQHTHHSTADHHHHDDDNKKHNHSNNTEKEKNPTFPFHHHISPTNDFDYLRIELLRIVAFNLPLLTVLNSNFKPSLSEPPEIDLIRFTDKPFLITIIFEPGATGLRGPPPIA